MIDEFYTLNFKSIKSAYKRLLDMHTNFPPFTELQLIETIKQLVSDIPYDGTLKERNEFIEATVKNLIKLSDEQENSGSNKPAIEVADETNLKEAILNGDENIKLTDNITITNGNLNLGTVKHFNGNGKTITFNSTGQNLVSTNDGTVIENVNVSNTVADEKWSSTYGIQCYNGTYTIKNCSVSGCNGGILVNSSTVKLEGTIDVSNNTFGGIEVSKSSAEGSKNSILNINNAKLINSTEKYSKPTVWTDGTGCAVNGAKSMFINSEVREGQIQYYLQKENIVKPATEVEDVDSLRDAILNGDTDIKLINNIDVESGNLDITGVKHFDGDNKTITFNTTGQNFVSTTDGAVIENVIVDNKVADENWSSTYGIQVYNGNYTIKNVTTKGGNAGILVNSANVKLEGTIDVSNNTFGGIEVSRSSNLDLPNSTLNINGATIINRTEIYARPTIWTDGEGQTIIGADNMFINNDVKKGQVQYYLEEFNTVPNGILLNNIVYDTLEDAINAVSGTDNTIKMYKDTVETLTVPVGKDFVIEGNGHSLTGDITLDSKGTGITNLTFKDINLIANDSSFGIFSKDQTKTAGNVKVNVKLQNCTFQDYTGKAIYLTNVQNLDTNGCTFTNCATGPMNDPNTVGDYVVDLNLVGVQDVKVNIDNCIFNENKAQKSVIKVAARGGDSDADANDIPKGVAEATVSNLVLTNCSFMNNGETEVKDINIGTTSKTEGNVKNTTGAYPVTINNNKTNVIVSLPYKDEEITVLAGEAYIKEAEVFPNQIQLDKTQLELEEGQTYNLNVTVLPDNTTDKSVMFVSENNDIATVDNVGKIVAIKDGNTTITVKSVVDQKVSAICNLTVNKPVINVTGVQLNKESIELNIDETEQLIATVSPDDATNKELIWSSENDEIATVSNGLVTAVSDGTTTITVETVDGNKTDSCEVIVNVPSIDLKEGDKIEFTVAENPVEYSKDCLKAYQETGEAYSIGNSDPATNAVGCWISVGVVCGFSVGLDMYEYITDEINQAYQDKGVRPITGYTTEGWYLGNILSNEVSPVSYEDLPKAQTYNAIGNLYKYNSETGDQGTEVDTLNTSVFKDMFENIGVVE